MTNLRHVDILGVVAWITIIPPGLLALPEHPISSGHNSVFSIVEEYFKKNWSYAEILDLLFLYHGITWSIDQLKYVLRKLDLRRYNTHSTEEEVRSAILAELNGPGVLIGYKSMWRRLQTKYNIYTKRETVRHLLKEIDPEGVDKRSRKILKRRSYIQKGPNYVYHVDGYDKLKPFGFAINGCIDGYSRRIMWLEVGPSNSNPRYIAKYYLDCVERNGGYPRLLRVDPGTENGLMCAIHATLREDAEDELRGEKSYRYGKSTSNQRIEAWWSFLKRHCTEWWITLFKNLEAFGAFTPGHEIQRICLRYCFMDVLQRNLNEVANGWNNHRIRKQRNVECLSGVPNTLHFLPSRNGTQDYITATSHNDTDWAKVLVSSQSKSGHTNIDQLLTEMFRQENLTPPTNWEEALATYFLLDELLEY